MKLVKEIKPKKILIYSIIIFLGVLLDSLSKLFVILFLKPVGTVPIINGIFHLTYVENPGAAWGMLAEHRWVFMVISSVAIIGIILYLYTGWVENKLTASGLLLITSGGIGNMIDRIALGYVVDFLSAEFIDFPVFNVADSFVTIGAGLLILSLVIEIIKEKKQEKEKKSK